MTGLGFFPYCVKPSRFTKALWGSKSLNNESEMKQTLNHDVASRQTGNSLMDQ